ncbi:MAG: LamG-like jellyroll fold domain-containing protein, partial [Microgenomates group bacterium]
MKRILHQIKSKIALNKYKLRKPLITFGVFIALAGGFLFYTINASAVSWWTGGNGAWGARKQLTVTNNSAASLSSGTSIAISIDTASLVGTGKLRPDCADLRILYQPSSSTTTELTRHIVFPGNSTCATSTATKVYFKIQSSLASAASSTDYYLYYKNLSATAPTGTDDAFDVSSANATLVCPFNGTTTCAAGETPSTETGAIRYSGSKSAMSFAGTSTSKVTGPAMTTVFGSGWQGPFTIEGKFYFSNSLPNTGDSYWLGGTYVSSMQIGNLFTNYLRFRYHNSTTPGVGSYLDCNPTVQPVRQWAHVAVSYDGTTIRIFVNGVQCASQNDSVYVDGGTFDVAGVADYPMLSDEIRVSSMARYTSNFIPSTSPFVRDSNTKLLYHFDENGDDPRNTGKILDDSGNSNHGTITGAKYVSGLVGVDNGTADTGNVHAQSYAGHEGVLIEEGTTNLITNPSFENNTYNTNWTTGSNLTATSNATAPYYKFGVKSAKLVASASAISGTSNMFTTNINVGSSATHGFSAYVY